MTEDGVIRLTEEQLLRIAEEFRDGAMVPDDDGYYTVVVDPDYYRRIACLLRNIPGGVTFQAASIIEKLVERVTELEKKLRVDHA